MIRDTHNFDELLDRVAAGDLDGLTPEQVDALAARLNADADLAARLEGVRPPRGPAADDPVVLPGAGEWEAVYASIEDARASASASVPRRASRPRVLRLPTWVGSLMAAAACVMFAMLWGPLLNRSNDVWELRLGDDVQVLELEVSDEYTSFVSYDSAGGAAMIWIYEGAGGA